MKRKNFESNWIFEISEEANSLMITETNNNGDIYSQVVLSPSAFKALNKFVKTKEVFKE